MLIFGSWARGEQREESDIDLIVVSRDFTRLGDLSRLETLGIAAGCVLVSVHARGYTPEEFAAPEPTSFLAMVLSQKTVEIPVPRARRIPLRKALPRQPLQRTPTAYVVHRIVICSLSRNRTNTIEPLGNPQRIVVEVAAG